MVGGPVIGQIPIAALTGVMSMVVIGTFEWATFSTFGKVPKSEIFVILSVTLITVFLHNLHGLLFFGSVREFSERYVPAEGSGRNDHRFQGCQSV
jgi:SulP family sulfate permease